MIILKQLIKWILKKMSQYNIAHRISKAIIFFLVVLCLIINREIDSIYLDILAVFIWFFGVNFVAYLVESILHWEHKHDKL